MAQVLISIGSVVVMVYLLEFLSKKIFRPLVHIQSVQISHPLQGPPESEGLRCWHNIDIQVEGIGPKHKPEFQIKSPHVLGIYTNNQSPSLQAPRYGEKLWGEMQSNYPIEAPFLAGLAQIKVKDSNLNGCQLQLDSLLFQQIENLAPEALPQSNYRIEFLLSLNGPHLFSLKHYYQIQVGWRAAEMASCPRQLDVEVVHAQRRVYQPALPFKNV